MAVPMVMAVGVGALAITGTTIMAATVGGAIKDAGEGISKMEPTMQQQFKIAGLFVFALIAGFIFYRSSKGK